MHQPVLDHLLRQDLIAAEDAEKITQYEATRPFSLHWELKTLLYLGVLLINAGLGYLIYENIDSIGHAVLIALIGAVCAACFGYAFRRGLPFSREEVESPTPYFDYILLLGCLTFLLLEGYLQYQYGIFGQRYGLATFIPMVLFFGLAYRFDHRGVLSLGITALASWLGVTVTPKDLLSQNDFNSQTIVQTGVLLGLLLSIIPFLSERRDFKKHFSFTYLNFGVHILMVACLSGLMALEQLAVYFLLLCAAVVFFGWYAISRASFYFLTVAVLYGYIGFTWLIFSYASGFDFTFYLFYFVISCVGVIVFLTNYKRFFKTRTP